MKGAMSQLKKPFNGPRRTRGSCWGGGTEEKSVSPTRGQYICFHFSEPPPNDLIASAASTLNKSRGTHRNIHCHLRRSHNRRRRHRRVRRRQRRRGVRMKAAVPSQRRRLLSWSLVPPARASSCCSCWRWVRTRGLRQPRNRSRCQPRQLDPKVRQLKQKLVSMVNKLWGIIFDLSVKLITHVRSQLIIYPIFTVA